MNQTIYRVLHIYEGDYGCEEHAEPTAEVVLEAADGSQKTIFYSDLNRIIHQCLIFLIGNPAI